MAENDAAVDPFLDIRPARLSTGEAQPANHRALLDGTCRVMEARVHQQALPDEAGLYLAPCGVITSDTRARLSGSRSRTISIVRQPMLSIEGTWEHGVHQKSIEQLLPVPGVV